MDINGKIISFLGDSITEGVGVADQNNRFDNRLLGRYAIKTFNYGISGTRISYQSKPCRPCGNPQFDLYFCGRCTKINPKSDVIVVFGGTNDYGHGDAPFGSFEDTMPDTYCGAVRYLIRKLKELYPNAKLVFMTPARRQGCDTVKAPVSPDKKMLIDYVDAMIKIAGDENVSVLDLYRNLGINPEIESERTKYTADGLHFNDLGHGVIADKLDNFLATL